MYSERTVVAKGSIDSLTLTVNERLGGLVEIPLQMATQAGAVIEGAEQVRR